MNEVDLALWRSMEDIANDTKGFMNDGEWELLSVPSHYWKMKLSDKDYAHIQFNVRIKFIQFKKYLWCSGFLSGS